MTLPARILLAALPILLVVAGCGSAAQPVAESTPQAAGEPLNLQGRVNDAAGILSAEVELKLTKQLQALDKKTGHQLVIATTPSLNGEDIALYAQALGNRWGIGRKDYDDGIVILIAPHERQVRIAVGQGLEKKLTGAICSEIIQSDMLPHFKTGDFASGLEEGVTSLITKLT